MVVALVLFNEELQGLNKFGQSGDGARVYLLVWAVGHGANDDVSIVSETPRPPLTFAGDFNSGGSGDVTRLMHWMEIAPDGIRQYKPRSGSDSVHDSSLAFESAARAIAAISLGVLSSDEICSNAARYSGAAAIKRAFDFVLSNGLAPVTQNAHVVSDLQQYLSV